MQESVEYDVAVIGGGPAGATSAALLAQQGHRVLLVEREKFPRYHIGESLITGCLPVVEELGLWDRLGQLGFTHKYGGTLLWGQTKGVWDFRFSDGGEYEHSYQVRRADFDALLLARARELGADVVEEATVKEVDFDGDRAIGFTYEPKGADAPVVVRAKMVVDASGQQRLLGRRLDMVEWQDELRNVAVWSYFQGTGRVEGENKEGDILIESRPAGWFWFIPLGDGTTSVGYVTRVKDLQDSGKTLEELFAAERAEALELKRLMADSRQVSGWRTARDWSYSCHRFTGPGWAVVGDSAAFVDPLFSTGVTLAMRGASDLAKAVDEALRNPEAADKAMAAYEDGYKDFFHQVVQFVMFFYNKMYKKEQYWNQAQNLVDPDKAQAPKNDFAALLSGLIGSAPKAGVMNKADKVLGH